MKKRRLLCLLMMVLAVSYRAWLPRANAQAGSTLTVGMVFQQIRDLIKDLDNRASALLQQGNSVGAQQQMLLSGLLSGALREMEEAYAKQMNSTVDGLMRVEKEAFTNLHLTLDEAKRLESDTMQDLSKATRQAHAATTEVLSRMPFANKYPVIHGLLTRDVLAEVDPQPDDIQVLGFFLVDPDLNELPEIFIDGNKLTTGVSAYFDRLQINLPPSIRSRLKFANTACEPRPTFNLWIRVHYHKAGGVWPVTWKQPATFDRNLTASPGDVQYEVSIFKSGMTTIQGTADEPFRVESPNFNWGCEENTGNHADFTVPAGHTVIEKSAGWADLGGRWENHGCSVSDTGGRVVGECHVRGGNKDCFVVGCNCPGGGHGRLAVWGKTRHSVSNQASFHDELVSRTIMRGSERYDTIAIGPNEAISAIKVEVRRMNSRGRCDRVADAATINLDSTATRRTTTDNGMLEVVTDGHQVSIKRN